MLLMPCTWVQHFLRMKTILHPSISSARDTFLSSTSCTFHSPLRWCFLLLGLNETTCITVSAQGDPLQVGGARAQRWTLLLITIIIGDANGRTRRQLYVIPRVVHLIIALTLTLYYWGIVGIVNIEFPRFWRTNDLSLWGLRQPRLAPPPRPLCTSTLC